MRQMFSKKQIEEMIENHVFEQINAEDVYIAGSLFLDGAVESDLDVNGTITGDEIVEKMEGYSFTPFTPPAGDTRVITPLYVGAVKTGNKLTLVLYVKFNKMTDNVTSSNMGYFVVPQAISNKLVNNELGNIANFEVLAYSNSYTSKTLNAYINKMGDGSLNFGAYGLSSINASTDYYLRYEVTFLLSDNLAA